MQMIQFLKIGTLGGGIYATPKSSNCQFDKIDLNFAQFIKSAVRVLFFAEFIKSADGCRFYEISNRYSQRRLLKSF